MNEIKKIHIGRQSFTIAVDAHRELQGYLQAIEHQVGEDADVVKEVEARMVELLEERGVSGEKVILLEDVLFLKEQLGAPGDFQEDGAGATSEDRESFNSDASGADKRLYRDTENAMIAGVAAGLAAYFRIDPLIVRLIFVVLTLSGGAGVLLYILLWILVPVAKTPSERLHMRGKAVTVDSIKEVIDRADIPGTAQRAGHASRRIILAIGQVLIAIMGVMLSVVAAMLFLGIMIAGTYLLVHGVTANGEVIFPLGVEAIVGLLSAVVATGLLALILLLAGVAMVRRKWTTPGWVVATIVGMLFVALSIGTAIGIDVGPQARDRYEQIESPGMSVESR